MKMELKIKPKQVTRRVILPRIPSALVSIMISCIQSHKADQDKGNDLNLTITESILKYHIKLDIAISNYPSFINDVSNPNFRQLSFIAEVYNGNLRDALDTIEWTTDHPYLQIANCIPNWSPDSTNFIDQLEHLRNFLKELE
ncbi:hypothetical protein Phi19:2_gp077 [Cellulophaga phage phi19:2]|uniref:Uncharacterized protein n=3 Tax=Cellulophaga phage phiST TaxID=756282 RepID=M4SPR3_9CAUD|nr:hypothetical protein CGPG_00032 [Cellulophaga phage phiST]AGH56731.1 hypothetical protein CGPG_00032 [Cellulophaga phage phiST]AGO47216.1 hypothetical protein PhiST_gp077 [Cellulophaga phage phiST]AGO48712.1 hypothetical protein Phi19:2_gp077 [Cellulophaga phage phi19:2]AGO49082.1 hypothetical protein Phi13:1_gp071 [Cellulophaga phage phi13:1]